MSNAVYMPIVIKTTDQHPPIPHVGVVCDQVPTADLSYQVVNLASGGDVTLHVAWAEQELVQGQIVWTDALTNFFGALPWGYHHVTVNVKAAPAWARVPFSPACGPIRSDMLPAYGNFIVRLCQRFRIGAVEIWNEPAVKQSAGASYHYGCLMDETDDYTPAAFYARGFSAYAPMIKQVQSSLRAAGLGHIKIIGGSMIGPDNAPFVSGMIDAHARPDFINLHWYPPYGSDLAFWQSKLYEYTSQLVGYGIPLLLSETNMILGPGLPSAEMRDQQAAYVRWIGEQYPAYRLYGLRYYCLQDNTWGWTGLVQDGSKTPAYDEYVRAVARSI